MTTPDCHCGEDGRYDPPEGSFCACGCGSEAEYRDIAGRLWCWPCKYAAHDTCPCSRRES